MTGAAAAAARSRPLYALLTAATIALGLATRRFPPGSLPTLIAAYGGDTLWAATAFFLAALLFPRASTPRLALGAAAFALAVELSQLYHAPWIDAVRATRPGALVLGFGFLRSDLACYAVGIILAALADAALARRGVVSRGS